MKWRPVCYKCKNHCELIYLFAENFCCVCGNYSYQSDYSDGIVDHCRRCEERLEKMKK